MARYTKEQIDSAYKKITELLKIVEELENTFEGRLFTLEGYIRKSVLKSKELILDMVTYQNE